VTLNEIDGQLEIEYPCQWIYKVIGADEVTVRTAVMEVVDVAGVTIELSNKSSSGKFTSVNVAVKVTSQDQRLDLYERLRGHEAVRMVL
jgi:hypothetical protein